MAEDDVNVAIESAYKAFETWRFTTAKVLIPSTIYQLPSLVTRFCSVSIEQFVLYVPATYVTATWCSYNMLHCSVLVDAIFLVYYFVLYTIDY